MKHAKRILLSIPHLGGDEIHYVREAFESNWLSTVGPNIPAFECELEARLGVAAAALGSGTAAIHLGLRLLGVGSGDEVLCQSLTFVATANPIVYQGATPVFLDSEYRTWNLDPDLLERVLRQKAAANRLPRAVVVVHLFGQCAEMDSILEVCGRYGVPVLEDAAEALGATYKGRPAGTLGAVGAFSFNGNKIITTTGGGMLVSGRRDWVEKTRYWASQAREPGIAFEHKEAGYNYRMSNVLAGIGRGQLRVLGLRTAQRRAVASRYAAAFADLAGIAWMPQSPNGLHTNWLSVFLIDEKRFGRSRDELIAYLDAANVESRPVWKPMHLQPLFRACEYRGGGVAEDLFRRGICLPSSSSLSMGDQLWVVNTIRAAAGAAPLSDLMEPSEACWSAREAIAVSVPAC
jgi:pyridoxal phosphate-dependent aminotransferase EpsN